MALNLNSGAMNSTINSGLHVRQFDPKLYQRMADQQKATFVNFLRLLGMKRSAQNMGSKRGFATGGKAKNVKNFKYEWQDIYVGTPLSSIASVVTTGVKVITTPANLAAAGFGTSTTNLTAANNATKINVPTGQGKMFHANDMILDRTAGESMLITAVSGDELTVVRRWGSEPQSVTYSDTSTGSDRIGEAIAADDVLVLISSAFAEGTYSAEARSYNPTQAWNYCQIFKRAVENTGTNEELDTYGNLNRLMVQRQMELEQFMIERSRAYFKGVRAEFTDSNGKKMRTTGGLDFFLDANNKSVMSGGFTYNKWIDFCEQAFAYGGGKKILVLNDKLMTMIQKEIINKSNNAITTEISPKTSEWGFSFTRLKTHKGSMDLLVDSTMNHLYAEATGFALETDLIEEMILRPDIWRENVQTPDYDGRKDEILGECGFKLISPDRHRKLVVTE